MFSPGKKDKKEDEDENPPSPTTVVLSILSGGPIAGAEDQGNGTSDDEDDSSNDEEKGGNKKNKNKKKKSETLGEKAEQAKKKAQKTKENIGKQAEETKEKVGKQAEKVGKQAEKATENVKAEWASNEKKVESLRKGEDPTHTADACNTTKHFHSTHDVLEKWADNATIHGIHYFLNRQRLLPWRRHVWGLLLLFSSCLMFWQISVLVKDYRSWETNTNVNIHAPRSMSFPEVTICNLNPVQKSLVEETGILGDPVNDDELVSISQPLEEFIQAASYNRKPIQNLTEFFYPVITVNGVCFKFLTDENITRPGLEGGLSVSLYVNSANYYKKSSNIADGFDAAFGKGVQIFAAQKDTTRVSQIPFELALPGTLQYISMQRQLITRETETPWKSCYSEAPEFTQPKCREECYAYLAREVCGCREYGDTVGDLPYCADVEECRRKIDDTDQNCEGTADCTQPPCSEQVYTTQSSAMSLGLSDQGFIDVEQFATILINYESIREEIVTEVRAHTFSQLLGNIGGQMGLFMGISVISIIEIFGELVPLRLLPRFWGDKRLYGMGSKER